MNQEQLMIERGTAAQELLNSQVFQAVSQALMDVYVGAFIQTAPEDEKTRSAAYFQSRALQDIHAMLNQWVAIKDNIMDSANESTIDE